MTLKRFFKTPAFISAAVTFLVMLIVIGVLGYLFIPRKSDNKLLNVTRNAIEEYNITVVDSAHIASTRILKACLRFAEPGTPYYEKYKALLDKDGLYVLVTSAELLEMLTGDADQEHTLELLKIYENNTVTAQTHPTMGIEVFKDTR